MKNIAIVCVAYNREKSLSRLLMSLKDAYYTGNVDLIISIDKSNNPLVSKFANDFIWNYGRKRVILHKENLGLKRHILKCGDFLLEYDAIIVLEDDLVVAPSFYNYAKLAVDFYCKNDNIAGISLYNYMINPHTGYPFFPAKNNYDNYFIQYAPSWGQVWLRKQWNDFKTWLANKCNEDFNLPHLPINISHWGEKSWLKYHIKYAIENKKYFVYPYTALSTTCGDVGEHTDISQSHYQTILQEEYKESYHFVDFSKTAIKYDSCFEREIILEGYDDLCVDLNGSKCNRQKNRFWLTTESHPYKVVKGYNLLYKPIEANIKESNYGYDIFLYDTLYADIKPLNSYHVKLYKLNLFYMLLAIKDYGFNNIAAELKIVVINRIKRIKRKIKNAFS